MLLSIRKFERSFVMTNLMKFENCNVEIIHDNNEGFLFELYSTGMALGQKS